MLSVQETYVNATEGYQFGESPVVETGTDSVGDLYRLCVREYGRCTGKVYVDQPDAPPLAVGWVFLKRMQYEDSTETYLREVWVTVHDSEPTRTVEHHYHRIS